MSDAVNHPTHYAGNGIEVIDAIEAWGLNFSRGNAVKYIARAGKKNDEIEDLKKAKWYIEREIEILENSFALSKDGIKCTLPNQHFEIKGNPPTVTVHVPNTTSD